MKFPRPLWGLLPAFVCLVLSFNSISASGDEWRPIDPAELTSKTPVVDKDADAEAIFWEVRVDDGAPGELIFTNYLRVKVYTDRGKESQSQIDLPYYAGTKIKDISARTIKPDNSVLELKKDDVHERTIVKGSGVKLKAKSFAMPGVEPGAIVEYRWREVWENEDANYVRLQFQREIPVRAVTYMVRPYAGLRGMAYRAFHMPREAKFEKSKDGFYQVSLTNLPAFKEEPRMPPDDSVRAWILLFYTSEQGLEADKFWNTFGKRLYEATK